MAKISYLKFKEAKTYLQGVTILPISKSLSNRLLVLEFFAESNVYSGQYSHANDTVLLKNVLEKLEHSDKIDIEDAGTVARFVLAACAVIDEKTRTIFGTTRMHERPIKPLAEALTQIGAKIKYLEKEGFFPLEISGTKKLENHCNLDPSLSSQFLTALLLISAKLPLPFFINLKTEIASKPYVEMSFQMLKSYGFHASLNQNLITIENSDFQKIKVDLLNEGDWSAAIYFLLINALHTENKITISNLQKQSFQGDIAQIEILKALGIECIFSAHGVYSIKTKKIETLDFDFTNNPDLAQPIACYLASEKITGKLRGLSTLKNKETDRIKALQNELNKIGVDIVADNESLEIVGYKTIDDNKELCFETYNDHRMAMSLSILLFRLKNARIENPSVVKKSFPDYWEQLQKLGVELEITN